MSQKQLGRKAWAKFYSTPTWRALRLHQLRREPFCSRCGAIATVAHHVVPHKGDWALFTQGALASVCKRCHDTVEQQVEVRGYHTSIGLDGWPSDPQAPVNKAGRKHDRTGAQSMGPRGRDPQW